MKLEDSKKRRWGQEKQKKSLEMERVRNLGKERQIAKILYYGLFLGGVLLLAFAGDVQSPLHEGIAVTLMTIAAFRLNDIQEEEQIESSRLLG